MKTTIIMLYYLVLLQFRWVYAPVNRVPLALPTEIRRCAFWFLKQLLLKTAISAPCYIFKHPIWKHEGELRLLFGSRKYMVFCERGLTFFWSLTSSQVVVIGQRLWHQQLIPTGVGVDIAGVSRQDVLNSHAIRIESTR